MRNRCSVRLKKLVCTPWFACVVCSFSERNQDYHIAERKRKRALLYTFFFFLSCFISLSDVEMQQLTKDPISQAAGVVVRTIFQQRILVNEKHSLPANDDDGHNIGSNEDHYSYKGRSCALSLAAPEGLDKTRNNINQSLDSVFKRDLIATSRSLFRACQRHHVKIIDHASSTAENDPVMMAMEPFLCVLASLLAIQPLVYADLHDFFVSSSAAVSHSPSSASDNSLRAHKLTRVSPPQTETDPTATNFTKIIILKYIVVQHQQNQNHQQIQLHQKKQFATVRKISNVFWSSLNNFVKKIKNSSNIIQFRSPALDDAGKEASMIETDIAGTTTTDELVGGRKERTETECHNSVSPFTKLPTSSSSQLIFLPVLKTFQTQCVANDENKYASCHLKHSSKSSTVPLAMSDSHDDTYKSFDTENAQRDKAAEADNFYGGSHGTLRREHHNQQNESGAPASQDFGSALLDAATDAVDCFVSDSLLRSNVFSAEQNQPHINGAWHHGSTQEDSAKNYRPASYYFHNFVSRLVRNEQCNGNDLSTETEGRTHCKTPPNLERTSEKYQQENELSTSIEHAKRNVRKRSRSNESNSSPQVLSWLDIVTTATNTPSNRLIRKVLEYCRQ